MKKVLSAILLLCVLGFIACKREGLETYSINDSIYFANTGQYIGATGDIPITFAFSDPSVHDSLVKIRVNVTGPPSSQDRQYKISVDASSTAMAGEEYEAIPADFTFPAGKVFDTIAIKLLRGQNLKNKFALLKLNLEVNNFFNTNLKSAGTDINGNALSATQFSVLFTDSLTTPNGWYFQWGKFSRKKLDIICMLGSVTPVFLNNGDADAPLSSSKFATICYNLLISLQIYLLQEKLAGTPVYYEDGTPMATNDN